MTTFASDTEQPQESKAPPRSARRRAREFVLQGLYQWRVGGADEAAVAAQIPEMEDFAKADRDFFVATLHRVIGQQERLTALVTTHIDRPFKDLSPIEACVLLMGTCELVNNPETPYRVIINEAIELTKAFGGTDGHKYVNGVLDKVAAEVRPAEVEAKKKGR
jgi:N utilization substance protein B